MKHTLWMFLMLGVPLGPLAAAAGDEFAVDPSHSRVGFSVTHLLISKVRGEFTSFSGTFFFDEKEPAKSWVKGKIETAGITTQDETRDKHLKSPDFFDVQKYPEITFESNKIVKTSDGYKVTGPFTMHGVTKEITFPFRITGKATDPWGNERIGVEAALSLNRMDYGVAWSQTLDTGGLVVGGEVLIDLSAEFVKQKPKAAAPAK
jgi:polyisoprenoid-binding protein YceI